MKKTYINPDMKVVTMAVTVLQTASTTTPVGGETGQNLSRDLDFDEDDDF